jgi:hypothetical protein
VEIPHKREITIRKKTVVFKWIIGSLERGLVQPSSIGMPQRESRQVFYLAKPRDKITVSFVSLVIISWFEFTNIS